GAGGNRLHLAVRPSYRRHDGRLLLIWPFRPALVDRPLPDHGFHDHGAGQPVESRHLLLGAGSLWMVSAVFVHLYARHGTGPAHHRAGGAGLRTRAAGIGGIVATVHSNWV